MTGPRSSGGRAGSEHCPLKRDAGELANIAAMHVNVCKPCLYEGIQKLAECAWKPHRVCSGSEKPIAGLDLLLYARKTEGYGFIEFEISNNTIFHHPPLGGSEKRDSDQQITQKSLSSHLQVSQTWHFFRNPFFRITISKAEKCP